MIKTHNLDELINEKIIAYEIINGKEYTGSGASEELLIYLTSGKEFTIFMHNDGNIIVEVD